MTNNALHPAGRPSRRGARVPAILLRAGENAAFAADEFFSAHISNSHTRRAYGRAVGRFLGWCEDHNLELAQVTPGDAGRYIAGLEDTAPAQRQALAALRKFFDLLVTRHAVGLNSFSPVRGKRHVLVEGRTLEITRSQARQLLASIDIGTPLGRRDRCIIETFAYTGARVGAVAALRMEDFQKREGGWEVRFSEKGGQQRSIPVRYDLALSLHDYLEAAGIAGAEARSPFWRAARDRGGAVLTNHGISPYAIRAMLKRRLRSAGLPMGISPHSFRVFVVTDLLNQGVPVEEVQYLVGHASARTTAIYDRRQRRVSRNIVERISI